MFAAAQEAHECLSDENLEGDAASPERAVDQAKHR